jgi:hypothetical protein
VPSKVKEQDENARGVALSLLRRAASDTFAVCAESAENLALKLEQDAMSVDASTACRMLAHMYRASARSRG